MPEYRNEKHAREQTIGQAAAIAAAGIAERRKLSSEEATRIDALLSAAELLGLGTDMPREPAELVAFAKQPIRKRERR